MTSATHRSARVKNSKQAKKSTLRSIHRFKPNTIRIGLASFLLLIVYFIFGSRARRLFDDLTAKHIKDFEAVSWLERVKNNRAIYQKDFIEKYYVDGPEMFSSKAKIKIACPFRGHFYFPRQQVLIFVGEGDLERIFVL